MKNLTLNMKHNPLIKVFKAIKATTSIKVIMAIMAIIISLAACDNPPNDFSTPESAIVSTQSGKVRGYMHKGIYVYKGIPYANAGRFELPQQVKAWEGVRNSMAYGPVSPQNGPNVIDQSEFFFHHDFGYPGEDCHRVNVWSPDVSGDKKKPVMVWLHGGGFATGSGNELPSYDGENLARTGDVVVVNLNHRLNILGFLDLSAFGEQYRHTANLGLYDLIAALQWVRNNIASFGGDPDNVTIFGQSGGGRKVTALLSSPLAKGLFHKAIIQSGVSLEFYEPGLSQAIGKDIVRELGLRAEQLDSIRQIPYELLRRAGEKVLRKWNDRFKAEGKTLDGFQVRWGPVVDGQILPWQPADVKAIALMPEIPVLIGSTKHEFVPAFNTHEFREPATREEALKMLEEQFPGSAVAFADAVQKAYPEDQRPLDLLDVDIRGRAAVIRWSNLRAANSPVYNYLFTWESPILDGRFRSSHCLDLPFVFNNIERCQEMTGGDPDTYDLADRMSDSWVHFARTGSPQTEKIPKWPVYDPEKRATLLFQNKPALVYAHDRLLLQQFAGLP
jgi:para-nitrobenzyl esterase